MPSVSLISMRFDGTNVQHLPTRLLSKSNFIINDKTTKIEQPDKNCFCIDQIAPFCHLISSSPFVPSLFPVNITRQNILMFPKTIIYPIVSTHITLCSHFQQITLLTIF